MIVHTGKTGRVTNGHAGRDLDGREGRDTDGHEGSSDHSGKEYHVNMFLPDGTMRLSVMNPILAINAFIYDLVWGFRDPLYGNMDEVFSVACVSNIAACPSPLAQWQEFFIDSPSNLAYSFHPSARMFNVQPGSWPPPTWAIQSEADPSDWNAVVLEPSWQDGGLTEWSVNWDSDSATTRWAELQAKHLLSYSKILSAYRPQTHFYMDNVNLNVTTFNHLNCLLGIGKLRRLLNEQGIGLICNCSMDLCYMPLSDMDAISAAMDGISLEAPWNTVFAHLKWETANSDYYHSLFPPWYQNTMGAGYFINNYRRLLANGTAVICVDTQPQRYSGTIDYGMGPWTYSGDFPGNPGSYPINELWDADVNDRFCAAMAMITKLNASDKMYVCDSYNRKIGIYWAGGYGGSGPQTYNTWWSKDWVRWPEIFGNPIGDYTTNIVVNGANLYNTATQLYVDCDIIQLHRKFVNGTIAVNMTNDLSDDVNIRGAAVQLIPNNQLLKNWPPTSAVRADWIVNSTPGNLLYRYYAPVDQDGTVGITDSQCNTGDDTWGWMKSLAMWADTPIGVHSSFDIVGWPSVSFGSYPLAPLFRNQISDTDFNYIWNGKTKAFGADTHYVPDWASSAKTDRLIELLVDSLATNIFDKVQLTHIFMDNVLVPYTPAMEAAVGYTWANAIEALVKIRQALVDNFGCKLILNTTFSWFGIDQVYAGQTLVTSDQYIEIADGHTTETPWDISGARGIISNLNNEITLRTKFANAGLVVIDLALPFQKWDSRNGVYPYYGNGSTLDDGSGNTRCSLNGEQRFIAGMALCLKPTASSPCFQGDTSWQVSNKTPVAGVIPVKDWHNWPQTLGAPLGDATISSTVGGGSAYNSANMTYTNFDEFIISRVFQHGTLTVNNCLSVGWTPQNRIDAVTIT